ncbi:hypothetical protein MFLO_13500 [Listeria floridensis FSL S10-1187]|uniref:DUF3284 domain-containing protein n=1 Tax=Listeria floridensis FSL S10-1187 TaxID=1265817 RepID=A0ABN0RCC1_9LIST|nr:DUF3284 domain-containing protein [Listeria floridensis]EUJ27186.1 hypothetical protein MFLO_13500 [Listeria floridensis FSL S10-1187]
MNVSQKLFISQKECFDAIIRSVIYDIKKSTGKAKQLRQLQGFSYQRTMANGVRTTTTISEVTPNEVYQFETATSVNKHITTYSIVATSETTCEVTYNEKMESDKTMRKLNDMIVGFLFGFFRKKRARNLLRAIEQSVINESKAKKTKAETEAKIEG